jgi:hypothetical protein
MSFDFFPDEQNAALLSASRHPSTTPDPGVWDGFVTGAGQYAMRSLAEAGRAVDMAGAVFPVAVDAVTGGAVRQDQYFKEHDEVFNNAVDYWTPKPGEVGMAGQVAGQLAGGVLQAIISPALLVGSAQLSSAEDLLRGGVDADTAQVVGGIQGASMVIGIKLPYLGQTLTTRVLSGAGGNLVQGTASAGASAEVLKDQSYEQQAERFNPWDLRARTLDLMLGAAFGGLAHSGARSTTNLTPQQDYRLFLSESGISKEEAEAATRNTADQTPMPPGVSKITRQKSSIEGDGMFATENIGPGESLAPARIDGKRTPAGRFTNHSHEPNAEFHPQPGGNLDTVAIRPIEAGEEVTINYRQAGEVNGSGFRNLTPTEEAAILVANQARHLEDATPQGRPATDVDATVHADAMRQAIEQVLRGETVAVDALIKDMRTVPDEAQYAHRAEVLGEAQRLAAQESPVQMPILSKMDTAPLMADSILTSGDPTTTRAHQFAQEQPDFTIPTGRVAEDGTPINIRAADAIALDAAEVAHARATAANVFKTAANCLLGVL